MRTIWRVAEPWPSSFASLVMSPCKTARRNAHEELNASLRIEGAAALLRSAQVASSNRCTANGERFLAWR